MRWMLSVLAPCMAVAVCAAGCRSGAVPRFAQRTPTAATNTCDTIQKVAYTTSSDELDETDAPSSKDSESEDSVGSLPPPEISQPGSVATVEEVSPPQPEVAPSLGELAQSVRVHFPLIQEVMASRMIASGERLSALGAFDHQLAVDSTSQPLDFYKNYRNSIGVKRDTFWGGQTFAGYRIGRGSFEPWYLERETNKGGEFMVGVTAPLAKDRTIDKNRAELWRAQLEQGRVEPEIRAMMIGSLRDASIAYWQWVAVAANYRIAEEILQLAVNRTSFLEQQVKAGQEAGIDLVDNERIIVSRRAEVIDARRKLEQSAVKLSLFLRNDFGEPVLLPVEVATVTFSEQLITANEQSKPNIELALANRPELEELQLARRQLDVLLRQAGNETLPEVDAGLIVSQDVGEPTSSLRDKSQLKLEAILSVDVPLERRQALGKVRQLRAKIAQIRAKTRFSADKITAEAQASHAALLAAAKRVKQATEGLKLAKEMQEAEQTLFDKGQSTLFNLNIRELQLADAAKTRVAALFDYYAALADYAAALGFETAESMYQVLGEENPPMDEQ